MITQYQITDAGWTAISTAGQSGSCWMDDDNGGTGTFAADVRILHAAAEPGVATSVGKRVLRTKSNNDVLILDADGAWDIFFARAMPGKPGLLSVDMV
ncbi:MAG: hypothetical protein EHM48_02985 [Planctomycetaceae bacterium]|nr:MAG: hypothetical protein EHM48_02985 [Planctomycetaceae bacterium]